MKNVEEDANQKPRKLGPKKIIIIIVSLTVFAVISTWMLYPIRNHKADDVALRFLKNNEILKSEVGEITKIIGYGLELPNRSEEIAKRIKNGEDLSNINASNANHNSQVVMTSDGYGSWRSGKLIGSNKTIEVNLYLRKEDFGDFGQAFYYRVTEAKYRNETGEWKNIQIGRLENYLLLFK
jgi:hypothetical protein